ncbi:MAG: exodeoxyribonuclease V subunit gamma [Spirochaetota bacterium]|jgi:exonuclease V gamma subunit|nr:exodeoxyribonuclease V subunit gamma [Spirochaetota bacterium]
MVCRIHIASAFKELAEDLGKHLFSPEVSRRSPLLAPIVFVPTDSCRTDLRREWVRARGIVMNLNFSFFGTGLRKMLHRDTPWSFADKDYLHHQILCCLLKEPGKFFADGHPDELRFYELAGLLAEHFENYDLHRAGDAEFQAVLRTDPMQAALYGTIKEKISASGEERFFLREICSPDSSQEWRLDEQKKNAIAVYGLHLFAFTDIPPLRLRILKRLCAMAAGDLHIWHLSPAALPDGEYVMDELPPIRPASEDIAQKWTRASRSLLRTAAKEYTKIILDGDGQAPSILPVSRSVPRLSEAGVRASEKDVGEARGVRIVGAPSILRELEFAYNSILWHLADDKSLAADDFAILMPDPELYRASLEMVFSGRERAIPYSFMGKSAAMESHWAKALKAILDIAADMAFGFSRGGIARILDNDCILAACGAARADLEGYLRWIDALGVFGGEVLPPDLPVYSWARALTRLRLGRIMRLPEGEDWQGISPWQDRMADEDTALAPFCLLLEGLWKELHDEDTGKAWAEERLTGKEWAERLRNLCDRFIVVPPEHTAEEEHIPAKFKDALVSLNDLPECGFSLIITIVEAILQRALTISGVRGRAGVRVSRIEELYAHPAEYIYILGMNEGVYPQPGKQKEFDLRVLDSAKYPADIDESDKQRMMFVSALHQAKRCAYISYLDKDPIHDAKLYPSSLIFEFKNLAQDTGTDVSLPLTGYTGVDAELCKKYSDIFTTYFYLDKTLANSVLPDTPDTVPCPKMEAAVPQSHFYLSDFARYCANPAEGLLRYALGKKENALWNIISSPVEPFFRDDVGAGLRTAIKNAAVRSFLLSEENDPEEFLKKHCNDQFRKQWEEQGNIPSDIFAESYWERFLYGKDGLRGQLDRIKELPERIAECHRRGEDHVYSPFIFGRIRHDPPVNPQGALQDALQYAHPSGEALISGEIPLLWRDAEDTVCIFVHQDSPIKTSKDKISRLDLSPSSFSRILGCMFAFLPCFRSQFSFPDECTMFFEDGARLTFRFGDDQAEAFKKMYCMFTQAREEDFFHAPIDALLACARAGKLTQDALLAELQEKDAGFRANQGESAGRSILKLARPRLPSDEQLQVWYTTVIEPFMDALSSDTKENTAEAGT